MIAACLAALLATTSPLPDAMPTDAGISVDDVLRAVDRSHPALGGARLGVEAAEGLALSARGAFDPRLRARVATQPLGYYDWTTLDTEVRARTMAFGMVAFAGWRIGRGDFPIYDGRLRTAEGGELRAGLELPLLQGGRTDPARATRKKAERGRSIARLEAEQRRLELLRDAAVAYWEWIAAGEREEIRARQLELAQARDAGLRRQIADGNAPEIEALDNERLVVGREAALVVARRDLRRAALELSLFLRTAAGDPIVPTAPASTTLELPGPLADDRALEPGIARAIAARPDLALARARLGNADVDVALAKNQLLPRLDTQGWVAKDVGRGVEPITRAELGVAVTLELPVALRTARGELRAARASHGRIARELAFMQDRVAVDVRAAYLEMTTARRRAQLARRQAELAERIAQAERARFALGDSTILVVNLREEGAAEAAAAHVDAITDYRKARVRYQAATGEVPRH